MTPASRFRIVFAGTPEFSVPPLKRLIEAGLPPVAVLSQPDRPAGRGRKLQASPVKTTAAAAGLPIHQPISLRGEGAAELVSGFRPDLIIVVAYGLILPESILRIPRFGCWNIHASLLPRWRGAAPIQRAIEAGDRETGVCIMQMDAGLDTGPLIECEAIRIASGETGGSLHDRLSELGADRLIACVQRLQGGEVVEARPQPDSGVSYANKLDKAEARIDWTCSAEVLERRIRAFNPWPVTWCMIGGERTRIWNAEALEIHHDGIPGTVLAAGKPGIEVTTGSGVLRILELQPPGKRRQSAVDYLNAKPLPGRLDSESE